MGRKNRRSHKPRRHLNEGSRAPHVPRTGALPNITDLVLPVGKCGRKFMFTEDDAPRALDQARRKRIAEGSAHIENRYYECDRCKHWHLTERQEYIERGTE